MYKMSLEMAEDLVDQEKKVVCVPWQIVLRQQTNYTNKTNRVRPLFGFLLFTQKPRNEADVK